MLDTIIDYYKGYVSSYSLVFRYCKWTYSFFTVALYLFTFSFLPFIITIAINKYKIIGSLLTLSFIFFGVIMFYILNKRAKKIISEKYYITSNKKLWYCADFDNMQEDIFIDILKDKELFTESKLKHLAQLLQEEVDRTRLPPLVMPSILFAFTIPAWVQFLNLIYNKINVIEFAAALTIVIFFVLLLIVEFVGVCRMVYYDTIDTIINRKSYTIKKVKYLVNIAILKIPNN